LSVIALLGLVLAQVILGLFAVDTDGIESGPLSYLVSFETGRVMAKLHEQGFTVLQLLVLLHVAAIVGYLVLKKTNLVRPMITGSATVEVAPIEPTKIASWWNALVGIAISAAIVWYIASGG
jgi:cytochrome b